MMPDIAQAPVRALAAAVREGRIKAVDLVRQSLHRIATEDSTINAVTCVLTDRALSEAAVVDVLVAAGKDPGPLAGVPYGVKDLFAVAGLPTTAGAARLASAPAATEDAEAIVRLRAAGAVLVATLNMDEFAYGFVTDNAHCGITRNPHDTACFAGGSSGGSAAAVAAGMMSFALGSDTNGSIRIPASLCGIYGIKPTHASLPMEGVYPFVNTLDDIGPLARHADDLAIIDAVLRAEALDTNTYADTYLAPRIGFLGGWFHRDLSAGMSEALGHLKDALECPENIELTGVPQARSAAFLITAYEGGQLHRSALCEEPLSYDPSTRDRLLVGAALPADVYHEALAFQAPFAAQVEAVLARYDILIAPTVYGPAPRIDDPFIPINGVRQPARANMGIYTQPLSFLGLPVVAAPLAVPGLPLGIQIVGRPGKDRQLIAFAAELERRGLIGSSPCNALKEKT